MINRFRWCIWFLIGNCALFWLIGLNYVSTIPWIHSTYLIPKWQYELKLFVVMSYLGQLAFLAFIPALFLLPLLFFFKRLRFIGGLAVVVATLSATLLLADTIIYQLYRFHLNGVVWQLVLHGLDKQFFDFSTTEFVFIPFVILVIAVLEMLYAIGLWRYVIGRERWLGLGKWFAIVLGFCFYTSICMTVLSDGQVFHRVLVETGRFLPLYFNPSIARVGESYLEHSVGNKAPLQYPLQALQFKAPSKKLNLVIILVDTWRYDMLNKTVTPSLYQFARKAWVFTQHASGGNSTGPGVFSLFYGMPSSYWGAMETHSQGPVLIEALLRAHYEGRVFFSGSLKLPAFDKTVFADLKKFLPEPVGSPYERDVAVTQQFIDFVSDANRHQHPFFTYVHLESAHGFCALNNDFSPFHPAVAQCNRAELTNQTDKMPYLNRYKNALYLDDQLVQKMLSALRQQNLLNQTVVVITGDHGEEFNDNHQGYSSHASNFTAYQVHTPLIVYWPHAKPQIFHHQTSHYDIAPTLMKRLLGYRNPAADYSVGKDLLDHAARSYLLVGGYIDYGLIEKDRITRIFSTGDFEIEKLNSQPLLGAALHVDVMQQAFGDMRRFYR